MLANRLNDHFGVRASCIVHSAQYDGDGDGVPISLSPLTTPYQHLCAMYCMHVWRAVPVHTVRTRDFGCHALAYFTYFLCLTVYVWAMALVRIVNTKQKCMHSAAAAVQHIFVTKCKQQIETNRIFISKHTKWCNSFYVAHFFLSAHGKSHRAHRGPFVWSVHTLHTAHSSHPMSVAGRKCNHYEICTFIFLNHNNMRSSHCVESQLQHKKNER